MIRGICCERFIKVVARTPVNMLIILQLDVSIVYTYICGNTLLETNYVDATNYSHVKVNKLFDINAKINMNVINYSEKKLKKNAISQIDIHRIKSTCVISACN